MNPITTKFSVAGKETIFETGFIAKQANGCVIVDLNGTVVLSAACISPNTQPEKDFFPLVVEYQERAYAAGKIPGSFFKREGRPSENEILTGRVVDRTIRPLFNDGMRNEVQVICTVLSSDGQNDPDVQAVNATSAALMISDIPFNGPVGACRVGMVDGKFVINPTYAERLTSTLDIVVCATQSKVVMLETKADQLPEETVYEGIKLGFDAIQGILAAQIDLQKKCGKKKIELEYFVPTQELIAQISEKAKGDFEKTFSETEKLTKAKVRKECRERMVAELANETITEAQIKQAYEYAEQKFVRDKILHARVRPDGRSQQEIRPLSAMVDFLPRVHGSAVFTRGQTQALGVVTLGMKDDSPMVEGLTGISYKRFFLHYSFPPYSVGEVKAIRGQSRREVGHGALAEKSVDVVMPSQEDFPYTVRLNSEITESNGSSSMASVCVATLALMDAGVPIKAPVAGIAMGLVTDKDKFVVLTDIQGAEDHDGDMDFKVAGSRTGVTAIQLDTKIDGLTFPMIQETLANAKTARMKILDVIEQTLTAPRTDIAETAPRVAILPIKNEKIGELIGPGGKNIKSITAATNTQIDIDDTTNKVMIYATSKTDLDKAVAIVKGFTMELEVGQIYDAIVEKTTEYGAFCGVGPKSGLCHVSEISDGYVKNVTDVVKEGDAVKVKVIGIDNMGRVKLSIKQAK
jgi:polyribonucleotide nucleotidyltransferase